MLPVIAVTLGLSEFTLSYNKKMHRSGEVRAFSNGQSQGGPAGRLGCRATKSLILRFQNSLHDQHTFNVDGAASCAFGTQPIPVGPPRA
jgi:hypothetical protein